MIRAVLIGCVTLACAHAGVASAADIRGRLRVPRTTKADARTGAPRATPRDAIVWIQQAPEKIERSFARRRARPHLVQSHHRFEPRVVPVVVGDSVIFVNRDVVYHNAFSRSPVRPFDLGRYAGGRSRIVRFDQVGRVDVYCDIDPRMAAVIYVVPHPVFVQPDAAGRFKFKLPKGTYTVTVWHPDYGEIVRTFETPRLGHILLDLSFEGQRAGISSTSIGTR